MGRVCSCANENERGREYAQKMGQLKSASNWVVLWLHPLWVWQMVTMETHVEIMLIGRNDSDSSPYFEEPPPPIHRHPQIPMYTDKHTHTHTPQPNQDAVWDTDKRQS